MKCYIKLEEGKWDLRNHHFQKSGEDFICSECGFIFSKELREKEYPFVDNNVFIGEGMKPKTMEEKMKYAEERQEKGRDLLAQGYNLNQIIRVLDRKYPEMQQKGER